jgi:2-polyprenyl-3-methyl-5-hydroxy-6-metoxy-1,4-benzoquinol methylase
VSADYRAEFYAAYASTHTAPRKGTLTAERLLNRFPEWDTQFARFLPAARDAAILDAGCGDGALLWWLQQRGYRRAEGVEVSGEQVSIARSLGIANVHEGPLERFLESRTSQYDLVILRNVLEHFRKDEIIPLLQRCRASLRPSGAMLLQVPNGQSPFFGRIFHGDFTHEVAFTAASLGQILGVCRFSEWSFHPVRPVFGGRIRWLRRWRWLAVERWYRFLLASEVGPGAHVVTLDILAHVRP